MRTSRSTELQQRCRNLAKTLDIPEPFDLHEFLARLQRQRQREISLMPMTAGLNAPSGMWISTATTDYVFYDAGALPARREHIIFHELSHILFGHSGGLAVNDGDLATFLLPDLPTDLITRLLGRAAYDTKEEQEAEALATVLLQRAAARTRRHHAAPSGIEPGVAAVLANVEQAWGRNG